MQQRRRHIFSFQCGFPEGLDPAYMIGEKASCNVIHLNSSIACRHFMVHRVRVEAGSYGTRWLATISGFGAITRNGGLGRSDDLSRTVDPTEE
jgi:hypothetical protein